MGALFYYFTIFYHQDQIPPAGWWKPVGDDKGCPPLEQVGDGVLDELLGLGVDGAGGLVQHKDARSASTARAKEISCFSPVERRSPLSPTSLS